MSSPLVGCSIFRTSALDNHLYENTIHNPQFQSLIDQKLLTQDLPISACNMAVTRDQFLTPRFAQCVEILTPARTLVRSNILVPESGNVGESAGEEEEENDRNVKDCGRATQRQIGLLRHILVVLRSIVIYGIQCWMVELSLCICIGANEVAL